MKYLQYLKLGLLLLGVIVIALAMTGDYTTKEFPFLGLAMNVSFVMFFATVGLAILMPLIGIIQNPAGAIKSLIGLALVAVVVAIAYAMASDAPVTLSNGKLIESAGVLKFTDTALFTTFIAFAGVIVSIVCSEFYRIFK